MKKLNPPKLSKKNRIIALVIIGLSLVGLTALFSNRLITPNEQVYEPEVVSNYQPNEETVAEESIKTEAEQTTAVETSQSPEPAPATSQWPVLISLDQASSLTVVVNKKHKLPESYAPGLRSVTSNALSQLTNAAANAGIGLKTLSSYRSYATQEATYSRWVARDGQALADTYSARPGHSEHQTGLAIDVGASSGVCDLETCFGNTAEGKWVADNAQNYGFIIRYPSGKDAITGYQYEPWHLRYVGVDAAVAIKNSGLTMDQYYGVEGGGYN